MKKTLISKVNKDLIIPGAITLVIYLISYYVPKYVINEESAHIISFALDQYVKLFTPSVVIYILSYAQWFYCYYLILTFNKKQGIFCFVVLIVASLIGFACFMLYPTKTIRNELIPTNIFDQLMLAVYAKDSVLNAMPSFHTMWSWYSFRMIKMFGNKKSKFNNLNLLFSILVFISTQLTKQHYLIDVPAGILIVEIGIFVAKKIIK